MDKTFIFDLDDTLTYNQHLYSYAQLKLAEFILAECDPTPPSLPTIVKLQEKLDVEAVSKKGFSIKRFPESCESTFIELARRSGLSETDIAQLSPEAYAIGEGVFDTKNWTPYMTDGAEDALNFVKRNKDGLYLVTLGDPIAQKKKIEYYRLDRWFDSDKMNIVPRGKGSKIEEICNGKDKDQIWFVGNSNRSDIQPALESGIGAIYVPQETWAYDNDHPQVEEHPRLVTLDSLDQFKQIYETGLP